MAQASQGLDVAFEPCQVEHVMRNSINKVEKMAEVIQLPDRPTNRDLAKAITQLHVCFDEHRTEVKTVQKETDDKLTKLTNTTDDLKTNQNLMIKAFDIKQTSTGEVTAKATPFIIKITGKDFIRIGASVGAVLTIWKLLWTIAPSAWQMIIAINHMAIH